MKTNVVESENGCVFELELGRIDDRKADDAERTISRTPHVVERSFHTGLRD